MPVCPVNATWKRPDGIVAIDYEIYLIGLSAGAFLLSTLVYVFRVERLEKIGKLALFTALVTLFAAMFSIWLDLGHPERVWRLILRTNFGSIMGWMIWFYSAYFVLLLVELWFAIREDLVACGQEAGFKGAYEVTGKVKVLEGLRPGTVAVSWSYSHWALRFQRRGDRRPDHQGRPPAGHGSRAQSGHARRPSAGRCLPDRPHRRQRQLL